MKKLLSLPQNLADTFHKLDSEYATDEWFVTSDPADIRLGSGAGTAWLLDKWMESDPTADSSQKKIIIHAGGQSRRLPAYATAGKVLTPIPVLRWAVGQQINQNLLSLQLPLYEQIMKVAPVGLNTLIASGDVCLRTDARIRNIPEADVVCYGLWADPQLSSHHGIFLARHETPDKLDFMLQKPSVETLNRLSDSHYYMMDIGLWLLSDRAIDLLCKRSHSSDGNYTFYDLYSQFGCALGENPSAKDEELQSLKVVILPLPDGEFYHFGTTRELLTSTLALQNKVMDQRLILHRKTKPNPALFTQNCIMHRRLTAENENVWVENSFTAAGWSMTKNNVITGVPENDWQITLPPGACLDIEPVGESDFVVRPYGFDDAMRGLTSDRSTSFMGQPLQCWLADRGITLAEDTDIQSAGLFPVVHDVETMGLLAKWMISEPDIEKGREAWINAPKLSADEISARASLPRLYKQRDRFLASNIHTLAENHEHSIFYQLDLDHLSHQINRLNLPATTKLPESSQLMQRIRNHMLRARVMQLSSADGLEDENMAYGLLRQGILATIDNGRSLPRPDVHSDQIVWGRSPVRIDLAGGWTDTPPYSILRGGNVANTAIELNGQPPLQVFIKPCKDMHIIIRSIDLGASETVKTYEQLTDFHHVGSPFSIPKAALALAGFAPDFCPEHYKSLQQQLEAIGFGIELTLLSAVPAGSGLGTSSILAATVLGALSDFCSLAWDSDEIGSRTLALEQLLTSGGGWQDQYGGVLQGTKLLQTDAGWLQQPRTNWLPDSIFTDALYAPCHLLYYTGITRTAKNILSEIVKRMFLNSSQSLSLLDAMRSHALDMAEAIQRRSFTRYGALVAETWKQNQLLDSGTNPPAVQAIINKVKDYTLGYKLPGAGGGGFLYMVAKDPEAAARIRAALNDSPANNRARFVDMAISATGLQISRS